MLKYLVGNSFLQVLEQVSVESLEERENWYLGNPFMPILNIQTHFYVNPRKYGLSPITREKKISKALLG